MQLVEFDCSESSTLGGKVLINPGQVQSVLPRRGGTICHIFCVGDPEDTYFSVKGSLDSVRAALDKGLRGER